MNPNANQPASLPPASPAAASTPTALPAHADEDVLDTAWVQRVDAVMRAYATDPQQLTQQLASLRAQYQQARFGKMPFGNEGHS